MTGVAIDVADGLAEAIHWGKGDGLVPAIVQHAHDGRVLMLGYVDEAALSATLSTGDMHFFSRSRQALWRKGETSGHVLRVVSIAADCDYDTLLCQALPAGPTCHRGTPGCFDGGGRVHPWLNELEKLISARRDTSGEGSYVSGLFAGGIVRMAQKVGEEGVETALAAATGTDADLLGEAADLLLHLMVLLRSRDLAMADVVAVLAGRHRCRQGG